MRQSNIAIGGIAAALALPAGTAIAAPSKPAPTAPTVTLTWRFEMPNDDLKQHVWLLVTQGAATKTYKLPDNFGGVSPFNQQFCRGLDAPYALGKDQVAKITFYEGGAGGYYAQRSKAGTILQIFSFAMSDGLCEAKDGCHQPKDKFLRKISIPANAKIVEKMEEKALDATEFKPFKCNPSREP